ncbi:MAG: hypothetical protein ACRDVE_20450 [Actinocrinis sp.]
MTDGYQVDPAALEGGDRITEDLAARADSLARELTTVFGELSAAAGGTRLSSALAQAGSAASQRMAQIVTLFTHIGGSLRQTAVNYRQVDGSGAERMSGIEGGL